MRPGVVLGTGTTTKAWRAGSKFARVRRVGSGLLPMGGRPTALVRLWVAVIAGVKKRPRPCSCLSTAGRVTGLGPGGLRPSLSDDRPPTPSPRSQVCHQTSHTFTALPLGPELALGLPEAAIPAGMRYKPVLIHQVWGWDRSSRCKAGPTTQFPGPQRSWGPRAVGVRSGLSPARGQAAVTPDTCLAASELLRGWPRDSTDAGKI